MMGWLAAALLWPLGVGWVVCRWAFRPVRQRVSPLLVLAFAVGTGLGIASLSFFLILALTGDAGPVVVWTETIVGCVVLGLAFYYRRVMPPRQPRARAMPPPVAFSGSMAVLVGVLGVTAINLALLSLNAPHGGWDAWASWNLKARFLFMGSPIWERAFSPIIAWSSVDYPLLLPANVARLWTYVGADHPAAPSLLAALFTGATLLLLVAALHTLRGRWHAVMGGFLLAGTPYFIRHGAAQYADAPFAFYLLAAVTLYLLHDHLRPEKPTGLWALAGLSAGLAMWTKNEGLLLVLVLVLARGLVLVFQKPGREAWLREGRVFLWGWVPVFLVWCYFKMQVAGPSTLLTSQAAPQAVAQVLDPRRTVQMGSYVLSLFLRPDALTAYLLMLCMGILGLRRGFWKEPGLQTGLLVLTMMLTGYFLVMAMSSADLLWQLRTATSRLFFQLWPTVLLLALLMLKRPAWD